MKAFLAMYDRLSGNVTADEQASIIADFFRQVSYSDAAWAVFFLWGKRPKRMVSSGLLTLWFLEAVGMSEWLFEESYLTVGDIAETIALLNDTFNSHQSKDEPNLPLSEWMNRYVVPLPHVDSETRRERVLQAWQRLETSQVFFLNTLLTGTFRIKVPKKVVVHALSDISGLEPSLLMHRLSVSWEPSENFFRELTTMDSTSTMMRPYPFFLARALEQPVDSLGPMCDWHIEWKWDGVRAQCIRREQQVLWWSRQEEWLSGRFPELETVAAWLPSGTVLDGHIVAHNGQQALPVSVLQTRMGRKKIGKKGRNEFPVAFMAYDILEYQSRDVRQESFDTRRQMLRETIGTIGFPLMLSPELQFSDWEDAAAKRGESGISGVDGYVLKRLNAAYQSGCISGDWWKWEREAHTVDVVLVYAQSEAGRFFEYTFAVRYGDALVPIAKTDASGLSGAERERLDAWIREHTVERFGPVRAVEPRHVFELAFDAIAESRRHKSGVTLRQSRILQWRRGKSANDIDTLDCLKALLPLPPIQPYHQLIR